MAKDANAGNTGLLIGGVKSANREIGVPGLSRAIGCRFPNEPAETLNRDRVRNAHWKDSR